MKSYLRAQRPVETALTAALAFYGSSWFFWGLRQGPESTFPEAINFSVLLGLTLLGMSGVFAVTLAHWRGELDDHRPLAIAWLSLLLGLVLSAVVWKESSNFYSVSTGVFVSLIVALAAGWQSPPARQPPEPVGVEDPPAVGDR